MFGQKSKKKIVKTAPRKKIGLALGGGGAKGLAHIGVIKVLREQNIPIDFIAGTSMGALVGAWYALNKDFKFLENVFLKIEEKDVNSKMNLFKNKNGLLFKNKSILDLLELGFANKSFQQCEIPFRAVATDVENGERVILDSNSISEAVRASIALPLIFKPVRIGERLLMDGGLSDPVPADVVKKMGADIVIAVDVSSKWINIGEEAINLNNMYSVISSIFPAVEHQMAAPILRDYADIVLRPAVLRYKLLSFNQADSIIDLGEQEARGKIEEIKIKTSYRSEKLKTIWEVIGDLLNE